jgi:hypothetical protein
LSLKSKVQSLKSSVGLAVWLLALGVGCADDFAGSCANRTAIERVYYTHRLGQKPPFEEVSPPSLIERLVKEDLRKEAVLKRVYGVEITPALLEAEVQRINTTTRAPEMMAEIKVALGNDPVKFANAFARPFLVERLLRDKFENDDALHAAQRREAETLRNRLLQASVQFQSAETGAAAGKSETRNPRAEGRPKSEAPNLTSPEGLARLVSILRTNTAGQFSETTWQLGARPAETNGPGPDALEVQKRFGPNAQIISSPERERDRKFYFEDLPADLQRVLRVQLRQPGDVSAVLETPGAFMLYLAEARSDTALAVACRSWPKRNYEQWLSEQNEGMR